MLQEAQHSGLTLGLATESMSGLCIDDIGDKAKVCVFLTWRTVPMMGRLRVSPGTGSGHWSMSWHAAIRNTRHNGSCV